ncbi:MAG: hypothetical protein Q9165_002418 [Trypethelium subeluteriae]
MTFKPEPIAIVGAGCRLPGEASAPSKLWDLLYKPRDLLQEVDRFSVDGFYHEDGHHHGASNVRHSYLLSEDFRLFDPAFFNVKPVEAESIDPMQRLLLETVYETLENAGIPMESLRASNTACFIGVMTADYHDLTLRDIGCLPTYNATGTARSLLANRISYFFDWKGPSMCIDTACSSSLIALHQAIQVLRSRESNVAVAAGANLILGPESYIAESKLNMLSPTGRSRMWDKDADGYARGDGFAAVILKRLSDAIRDGDAIDCIVRETGTNQDGATAGITMPSPTAQAAMIRDAYSRAGLDLNKSLDRPQFFEAHGTGTKAGDPVEAEAIFNAFFGSGVHEPTIKTSTLHVGSIKTIIGHTEGTAGIAAVLKASLAIQNATLPPNMLFNTLNPDVEPFYGPLQIVTAARSWPVLPEGAPRRASVNSFGFGGSNAHAILEGYTPAAEAPKKSSVLEPQPLVPFVFSAVSEKSLQKNLLHFSAYLVKNSDVNPSDLAWTLHARRSALPVKAAVSAATIEDLRRKIDEKLAMLNETPNSIIGVRSSTKNRRILGVFTGQGAQWATMGRALLDKSPYANRIARDLDAILKGLPDPQRPAWSLIDELGRDSKSSRLQEAAISQPLCTVIQIILVDLLRAAGVEFSAVVGHSSGEIGAAYAAGFLTAGDALKIAYLRGLCASLAEGRHGQKGAMLAVGTSLEDAEELCALPTFEGRISVAAANSTSSVTLSGDADAVAYAKEVFEDEKKFVRLLKVDTAYHSHHMLPCSKSYLEYLSASEIKPQNPFDSCVWYSSVRNGAKMLPEDSLRGTYWKDNMENPVMFMQAVERAISDNDAFQLALEIGPHPALKAPATQTMEDAGAKLPYIGVLSRGQDDTEAFSDGLGAIWAHLGTLAVNLDSFDTIVSGGTEHNFIKGLPAYAWDHDTAYWYESRKSKLFRTRSEPPHELLGVRCDDGNDTELRWRNFLSPKEIPWLNGHQVQGQVVFPAAGYVSMALEAALVMARGEDIQLLELEELVISRAITFNDQTAGVETTVTLSNITKVGKEIGSMSARFSVSSQLARDHANLSEVGSGIINVILGKPANDSLPPRPSTPPHLIEVDIDKFYTSLSDVGYEYTGPFRALSDVRRRYNFATGFVQRPSSRNLEEALLVHPALLDPSFQALLAGYSWPGDGRLWTLHLPTSIGRIKVNPSLCKQRTIEEIQLPFNASLADGHPREIRGDVDIYTDTEDEACIQIEDIRVTAIASAAPADDRPFYSETVWGVSAPDARMVTDDTERATPEEVELGIACERVAYYFWRRLQGSLTSRDIEGCEPHHKRMLAALSYNFSQISSGKHPYVEKKWERDSEEFIYGLLGRFSWSVDIKLAKRVGEALPAVVRREMSMLEQMRSDGILDDFYQNGLGFSTYNTYLARTVKQITHRFPRLNLLEIGAGTGSATKAILDLIGSTYSSYTYTDITSGFFESAIEKFRDHGQKIQYKTLDIEKDPLKQGYTTKAFDVIIASNVIHATSKLEDTLKNARSLLKAGGYLLLLEITETRPLRLGFIMGGLSGWWLGVNDGRIYSPCISPPQWNAVLRKAGFSGVETTTPQPDPLPHPFSIITARASDEHSDQLRRPLSASSPSSELNDLYVLGGREINTINLAEDLLSHLGSVFRKVVTVEALEALEESTFEPGSSIISLLDLDGPTLRDLSPTGLQNLQQILDKSQNVLWVTHGCNDSSPHANAAVGLLRSVASELPHLRIQTLDFDSPQTIDARVVAECLMRLQITAPWERDPAFHDQLLWSTEPELSCRDGKLFIPRVMLHEQNNDRLNCQRRTIAHAVGQSLPTEIYQNGDSWAIRENTKLRTLPSHHNRPDMVTLKMSYSSFLAVRVFEDVNIFVGIGYEIHSAKTVIALASDRSSVIETRRNWTIPLQVDFESQAMVLERAIADLMAGYILSLCPDHGTLLVHEPASLLVSAVLKGAKARDITIKCTTGSQSSEREQWICLHHRTPERLMRTLLPLNISAFVDFAKPGDVLSARISSCLPPNCKIVKTIDLYRKQAAIRAGISPDTIAATLARMPEKMQVPEFLAHDGPVIESTITLPEIQDESVLNPRLGLIDWASAHELAMEIGRFRPETLFSDERTYLLIGLTGEIGRSLCQWMARNGAGAIVLASRAPRIEQRWIDELEAIGTKIKVVALDAGDRQSLIDLHADIKQTFPPIAGIANAAMVLHDQFFLDMTVETLNKVLRPKVDASVYLDEIFSDTPLDFFVMFSSLSSVLGNRGQSNYGAANMFMASLARQRKLRGAAGSVINIGRVVGLGYLERVGQDMENLLSRSSFMAISEVDLHHLFAQAIIAGLPTNEENPDIITALQPVRDDEVHDVPWHSNPRFSHLILESGKEDIQSNRKETVASARVQLQAATTEAEALEALQACFATKLQVVLQIPEASFRADAALVELGVDSLIAVDIRTWFLKEVNTDMPVLKIVGGASTTELCEYALESLPREMLPNLGSAVDMETTGPKAPAQLAHSAVLETQAQRSESSPESHGQDSSSVPSNSLELSMSTQNGSSTTRTSLDECNSEVSEKPAPAILAREKISLAQSRFWFLNLYLEDKTAFNVSMIYKVEGQPRIEDLRRAVKQVGQKHEALRTCFFPDEDPNEAPWQGVMKETKLALEYRDVQSDAEIEDEYQRARKTEYNLSQGETMRVILLSKNKTSHALIFGYHHIAMDGVSFQIFVAALEAAYGGRVLTPPSQQYQEFSAAQRTALEQGKMKNELAYWRREFAELPELLPLLPMAKVSVRRPIDEYRSQRVVQRLDTKLSRKIKERCQQNKVTTFHFYLAAFKTMLFRLVEAQHLCIGMSDANRNDSGIMQTIGLFLNLLPLSFKRTPLQTFDDALKEVRTKVYSALANSTVPFHELLTVLNLPRSSGHSPLFQAFLDYRQGAQEQMKFADMNLRASDADLGESAYDIVLDITESTAGSVIVLRGLDYMYDLQGLNAVLRCYITLLENFSEDPAMPIEEGRLFGNDEVSKARALGQGPNIEYQWPETLSLQVDAVTEQFPNAIALKDGTEPPLSYEQMRRRVNNIAGELLAQGVQHGDRVAVLQKPSSDWVCSLLGIVRVGGVYVPLDLRNPMARLAAVVDSSKPKVILAHKWTVEEAPELNSTMARIVNVSSIPFATVVVPNTSRGNDPAVILFTSGSTGVPKGIVLRHSNLAKEMEGFVREYGIGREVVLQQSAYSFDLSLAEIFTALAVGGSLIIVPERKRGDTVEIAKIIRDENVTYTKATPSEYSSWIQFGGADLSKALAWKWAFLGGEEVQQRHLNEFASLNHPLVRLYNCWGPAEVTISAAKVEIDFRDKPKYDDERIPVGRALPNYSLYILDEQLQPMAIGVPGEIAVSGPGVAAGYLDNDILTAEKFLPDKFATAARKAKGWTTMFRTGDRGRLRQDGTVTFEGRIAGDTQIKLRGIRIDLLDIENTMIRTSEGVLLDALVSVQTEAEIPVAHVVFVKDRQPQHPERYLQSLLADLPLPPYMRPTFALVIDTMPLTVHSKKDRQAVAKLPLPQQSSVPTRTSELTSTERRLKTIWEEVLTHDVAGMFNISSETDFFKVGGNSLLLVKLQSLIRQSFHVAISLPNLLDASMLGRMAIRVDQSSTITQIDWAQETELAQEVQRIAKPTGPASLRTSPGKVVVLTGATGHLGSRILRELVQNVSVHAVHCIAVRRSASGQFPELPVTSTKITIHAGDITTPRLGLSAAEVDTLSRTTTTIIHCAAKRSFWEKYEELRESNVSSTKELVRLAAPRRIPIHFLSSGGVVDLDSSGPTTSASAIKAQPPTDGSNGYVASKWASETYLSNAAHSLDIPTNIYRFTPSSSVPSSPAAIVEELLTYSRQLGALPDRAGWKGDLDLIHADALVEKICASALGGEEEKGEAKFVHYEGEIKLDALAVFDVLEEKLGKEMKERMDALEWVGEIKKLGFGWIISSQNVEVSGGGGEREGRRVRLVSRR